MDREDVYLIIAVIGVSSIIGIIISTFAIIWGNNIILNIKCLFSFFVLFLIARAITEIFFNDYLDK